MTMYLDMLTALENPHGRIDELERQYTVSWVDRWRKMTGNKPPMEEGKRCTTQTKSRVCLSASQAKKPRTRIVNRGLGAVDKGGVVKMDSETA